MKPSFLERTADFTAHRFGVIIALILVITMIFFVVLITVESKPSAEAMNSDTEIHQAYERYEDNFRPATHGIPFVCEAKDGNVLNMDEFRDIMDALDKVRNDKLVKPMLIKYYEDTLNTTLISINSVPNSIELIMNNKSDYGARIGYHNPPILGSNFTEATDSDLNDILDNLFQMKTVSETYIYREMVSFKLKKKNGEWTAPVLMVFIAVDNNLLEKNYTYKEGGEKGKEYFEKFDLHVMEILKDNIDTCDVYGVGVGVNEEIEKEIEESGPFMMFTFMVIVIILAITFRHNLKSFLAATIGLPLIIIWMMGSARLIGLSETTFTAFLPILIMALGVDYAIHSMKRYDEELINGKTPRESVHGTILKLSGTLALAMITTFVAFFSNILSTIPALRDWGIEAGLAIIWTFVIMGFFVPSIRLAFESKKKRDVPLHNHPISEDKKKSTDLNKDDSKYKKLARNRVGKGLSRITFSSMAHPSAIILAIILLVLPLGYGAMNLGTDFQLEDFFNPESDLVVGLDIYTEHFPTGGEPNILLIEGDVAEPDVIKAINVTKERLRGRGYATWYGWDVAQIVQNYTRNDFINGQVGYNFGFEIINITDNNNDDIPDSKEEIHAILFQVRVVGLHTLVGGQREMILRPDQIKEIIHYDKDSNEFDKTVMFIGVSGSGSLDAIKEGMDNIESDAQVIEDTGEVDIIVTGTGPVRYEQLTAISNSMLYSIIISIIVCLIIILAVFRRVVFSIIAILPVILIAVWLYGIMHFTGSNLNIVTATIGAMSIGVGVDYSIHVCDRFRKEKAEGKSFDKSMDLTISNSGAALLFSALTTSFGFFVLFFAPMPMFFSFGLFSGLMVIFAFIASVVVVPPLIKLTQKKTDENTTENEH
jgi:predicted RND superfamily exporter protein